MIFAQEVIDRIITPVLQEMEDQRLGLKARIKQLAREFKAKSVEVVKFDGNIPEPKKGGKYSLPRGWKRLGGDGKKTIFEVTRVDMGTRQRARMDACKLAGDYPADQHVVTVPQIRQVLEILNGRSLGLPSQRMGKAKNDNHRK